MMDFYEIAVIGGGIAGHSAALTAKSLKLNCLWLGEGACGGKAARSEYVRNYPAFTGTGEELVSALRAQREKEGLSLISCRVNGVYKTNDGFLITAGNATYSAKTVVLATGVEPSGTIAGEKEFLGRGVSYCAVCDGALYRGKKVIAVLSSPEFQEEADYLAGFAETVYAVCSYHAPAFAMENVKIIEDTPVAVEGGMRAERLVLKNRTLEADAVFFLKNSAPPEAIVGGLKTEGAHVPVSRDMSTNLAGLFAAGDVTGTPYQFAKAAGEGLIAAYSARAYLNRLKKEGEQ